MPCTVNSGEATDVNTYLAMDVGGSKYVVAIVNDEGQILNRRRGVWHALTASTILDQLLEVARSLLDEAAEVPVACGITIPGLADPKRGVWVEASFSGIRNFAICEAVQTALGIPTWCENDGQAYAMAEMTFGCCQGVRDFLFVNVSNGIGGSIVSDGKLLSGSRGFAGEFGHCNAVPSGRPCKCGQKGCLEMHAAGPGIARTYEEMGGAPDATGSGVDCKVIAERARAGDRIAQAAFDEAGCCLGRVLATAVNLLNPSRIVIGGGVSLAYDLFAPTLRHTLRKQIYAGANPTVEILPTPLGYDAGLYSAAAIARMNHQIFEAEEESL